MDYPKIKLLAYVKASVAPKGDLSRKFSSAFAVFKTELSESLWHYEVSALHHPGYSMHEVGANGLNVIKDEIKNLMRLAGEEPGQLCFAVFEDGFEVADALTKGYGYESVSLPLDAGKLAFGGKSNG